MIKSIHIDGFKSLVATDVDLGSLAVLVGNNGAGKSSFFRALSFLSDLVTRESINSALDAQGAQFSDLVNLKSSHSAIQFRARLVGHQPAGLHAEAVDIDAEFSISVRKRKFVYISEEKLLPWESRSEEFRTPEELSVPYAIFRFGKRLMYAHEQGNRPIVLQNTVAAHSILRDAQQQAIMRRGFRQVSLAARQLIGFRHFEIWGPEALRKPSERSFGRLLGNGANLAGTLLFMRRHHRRKFDELVAFMQKSYAWLHEIEFKEVSDNRISLVFIEKTVLRRNTSVSKRYNANQVSDGFLRMLALTALLFAPFKPTTIAYEEPENGLHPKMIRASAQLLRSISEQGTQVLISTHSPLFLNALFEGRTSVQVAEELRLVTRNSSGETKIGGARPEILEDAVSNGLNVGELWAALLREESIVA